MRGSNIQKLVKTMAVTIRDIVAFCIAAVLFIKIQVFGTLLGTDIASLGLVLFLMLGRGNTREVAKIPVALKVTYCLWIFGALLTDIYQRTEFNDVVRGWSKILFFGVSFLALQMLSRGRLSVLRAYLLGTSVGWFLTSAFFKTDFILVDSWKFGYSQAFTPLVAVIAGSKFMKKRFGVAGQAGLLLAFAVVNLSFNYRSMFGISVAATGYCILKAALDARPSLQKRFSPMAFAVTCIAGLVLSQAVIGVYSFAAMSGALGLDAKDKYEAQASGQVNLIQAGRGDTMVSLQAIADAPILGHGSWARDVRYVAMMNDRLAELGVLQQGDVYESDLIPAHSHVLGAWVQAGVGGGLFWLYVLWIGVVALYRTLKLPSSPAPFISILILWMTWDVLFSPFGEEQRYLMASKICIAIWTIRQATPAIPKVGASR